MTTLNERESYGQIHFIDNNIESVLPNIDINIGLSASTANIVIHRNTIVQTGKTTTLGGEVMIPNTTPPAHQYGKAGDKKGMIAFDTNHFYWCANNYVNNSTEIWYRVNWKFGNW